jgi:hypothetical protein
VRTYTSRRLAAMHWGYGVTEGQRCGDCKYYNRLTLYCQVAGTKGQCWNVGWAACGRWVDRGGDESLGKAQG